MSDTILKVKVFDKNLLSDLLFGDCSVDLRQQTIKIVDEKVSNSDKILEFNSNFDLSEGIC